MTKSIHPNIDEFVSVVGKVDKDHHNYTIK